ncbi:MAG: nucleotide exchange factor GrpE [Phycisphaerae bacterium]|nr:nucleotide exchange factor GrpE [Phycisphaerae bacterium]
MKDEKHKTSDKKLDKDFQKLHKDFEELQQQKNELFDKLRRLGADYANFQKRVPKQIADTIAYEKESIIKALLPVLDNFEHSLQHAAKSDNVEVVVDGVKIVYDQMLDILKSFGIAKIEALGEHFDPNLHQAMMQKEDREKDENIVLEEFQKGYKINDRVIRPSRVAVNKFQALADEQPEEQKSEDQSEEQ